MSAATELAPSVDIPPRALPDLPVAAPRPLASVTVLCPPRDGRRSRRRCGSPGAVSSCCRRRGARARRRARLAGRGVRAGAGSAPARGPAPSPCSAGDTLWSIATRVAPQRDPRAEVGRAAPAQPPAGVELAPGQVLRA